jgi:hypothetical protein
MQADVALAAVGVGLGATAILDLWAVFLKRVLKVPASSLCLLGRWICLMPQGVFAHSSISAAPAQRGECAVGWIAHYLIGAAFALLFIFLVSDAWLARPTLLPALLFGVVTVLFPYFTLQPAFGLGIAASKAPNPTQARLKSLMSHAVFGIGLYLSALGVSCVLRAIG